MVFRTGTVELSSTLHAHTSTLDIQLDTSLGQASFYLTISGRAYCHRIWYPVFVNIIAVIHQLTFCWIYFSHFTVVFYMFCSVCLECVLAVIKYVLWSLFFKIVTLNKCLRWMIFFTVKEFMFSLIKIRVDCVSALFSTTQ